MNLSRTEKITLISTFGVALLSIIIHLGIRFYFQADLRYEIGSYYEFDDKAVTYVKFLNYGKSDAEDVALNVEFPTEITDFSTDNPLASITLKSGGKGQNNFIGQISSIHPGETLTIYFSVKHTNSDLLEKNFLKQSTYKNGVTKTGKPVWLSIVITIFLYTIILIPFYFHTNKQKDRHYEIIDEILRLAKKAERNGITESEYMSQVEQAIGNTKFRKKGLKLIAESAFRAPPSA
ncbi:hypothetical protein [Hahella ganghwensis]|uniref:hypothetical protein n=1 Tax=Hahella ganghwensis TaxID=286420 RepID=UPI00037EEAFA|nr:hypothetical protein [Hahella ganghwensis]